MNAAAWLMYANIAVWIGIGAYLFYLGRKTARLESRLSRLLFTENKTRARNEGE